VVHLLSGYILFAKDANSLDINHALKFNRKGGKKQSYAFSCFVDLFMVSKFKAGSL